MGRLIATGADRHGHSVDFQYTGEAEARRCYMVCTCGWSAEITAFRGPGSIIESRLKFEKHMKEIGLDLMEDVRKFEDEDGIYTLKVEETEIKLECYLMGSPTGGTGTECFHTIGEGAIAGFLSVLNVATPKELLELVASYGRTQWRELHQIVMKNQTKSFVWNETDWS